MAPSTWKSTVKRLGKLSALSALSVGTDAAHFENPDQRTDKTQASDVQHTQTNRYCTTILTSTPLRNSWPATKSRMLHVVHELQLRSNDWEDYQLAEKEHYRDKVTPESKRNRALLLLRSIAFMDEYLDAHPQMLDHCIEVHSYDPTVDDNFLLERFATVPTAQSLLACSRGGYLIYAGNDKKPDDSPAQGDCVVIAGAPEGGGGALKLISPCWGQEEQAFMQIAMLFIAIYGDGFRTRYNNPAKGNLMEITPVLVKNVVPLGTLGSGAVSTRPPTARTDGNGKLTPANYSTSVFHGGPGQFKPEDTLQRKDGHMIDSLFYSFTDMRERYNSGDLAYRLEDLCDMATSAGKGVKLWDGCTPRDKKLHGVGVGTGIYEHAECVSAAVTMMVLALYGRSARIYCGERAFNAARDMVHKVFTAMALKAPPANGFTMKDYVEELHSQIGQLNDKDRVHWRIGGLKQTRSAPPRNVPQPAPVSRPNDKRESENVNIDSAIKV